MLSYTGRLSPSGIEWFSTRPLGAATPGGHFLFKLVEFDQFKTFGDVVDRHILALFYFRI